MKDAHRLGDANEAGGVISSIPQSSVFINEKLASVDGSTIIGPGIRTANGSSTVSIEGKPVNRKGDADESGDPRASGSPNVFIGGL
jgi:uncharacterized Zn-binding protein involved in type VI secretion